MISRARFSTLSLTTCLLLATRNAGAGEPVDDANDQTSPPGQQESATDPGEDPGETPETIAPAPPVGVEPAPGAPSDRTTNETGKRIGVGVDALLAVPFGDFADATGPLVGPTFRFGYRVVPRFEIALRAGYLFGTNKNHDGVMTRVDVLPLWLGGRFFVGRPFVGPYVGIEGGMNSLLPTLDPLPTQAGYEKVTDLRRRFGGNAAFGYLVSENLPFDVRLQVMLLNLIGRDSSLHEMLNVAVSLGVGYTFQF